MYVAITALLLLALVVVLIARGASSLSSAFTAEIARSAAAPDRPRRVVQEADLAALPPPVAAWLRFSGAVGRPSPGALRMRFRGSMRRGPEQGWMPVTGEQVSFFEPPTRLFYIRSKMFGLPFDGLHVYRDGAASMRIRLAGLLNVVDAKGPQMDQSETVTLLNDLCFMAPARLLDPSLAWTPVDARTAIATYTNGGHTVSATLSFDERGALVNFVSDDRYLSADGKHYERLRWTTPIQEHREFGGLRLPALAEARWTAPDGEYAYARFELLEIAYVDGAALRSTSR